MELLDYLKSYITEPKGFIQYLPLELIEIKEGYMKVKLNASENNGNPFGTIHGGCYFAVADTVAGTTAMTYGHYVTTTTGHIHYLYGAPVEEPLVIEAFPIKTGKNLMTFDVLFDTMSGETVCKVTLEYYVLEKIDLEKGI